MTPWFVLSYPRSRTAWLATYLTHNGVYAFHEAWQYTKTVKQLRTLMESKGDGPVVNVDCSNWFFLPELQQEFPEARFIEIRRPWEDVVTSSKSSYGEQNYPGLFAWYQRAMEHPVDRSLTIHFDNWSDATSLKIWDLIAEELPMDTHWHWHMHQCLVELMPDAIQKQLDSGRNGELFHIARRMQRG